jgi:hypothetical protein
MFKSLRGRSMNCLPRRNGKEARAELLRLAIEILVSGIGMPGLDG